MIAKEIGESLQSVRNVELALTIQEIYNIGEELEQRGSEVNMFGGECVYPAIFASWETYNEFHDKIRECRKKYEKNLPCRTALNLVFIDRYMYQLSLYMSENGGEEFLPTWGTIFLFDLWKWQKKMDKMLVKQINKYSYKLESHKSWKWGFWRKKELEKQWEKTILHYLLHGKCRFIDKPKMEMTKTMIDSIFKDTREVIED